MNLPLLIFGLVALIGLVVIHEIGHFLVAKWNGVEPLEFGLFFPPRILSKKMKGGWELSLNLLPLGGFVRLKGEHDTDTEPGSFGAASVGVKTKIMLAGIVMNLLAAYVLLVAVALAGMPQLVDNQFSVKADAAYLQRAKPYVGVTGIQGGSPANQAGISPNDVIVSATANGQTVYFAKPDDLTSFTTAHQGQTVGITYRKGSYTGSVTTKAVTLRSDQAVQQAQHEGRPGGHLGAEVYSGQSGITVVRSTWSAPIVAAGVIVQFTVLTFQGLGTALQGVGGIIANTVSGNAQQRVQAQDQATSQLSGPVGIFYIFKYGSTLGLTFMLFLLAVVSLTLAIMNVLPVPALDGGRLWIILISRALKRPLSKGYEEAINAVGFAFILVLVALITVVDVGRFH